MLILLSFALAAKKADPGFDARGVWMGIAETSNTCDQYDYFPSGGMRIFACHAAALMTYEELGRGAPRIWKKGPHTQTELDLDNATEFGHYDPDFVRWAGDALIPAAKDPAFAVRTQTIYDTTMRERARIAWLTWVKLKAEPGCAEQELKGYKAAIAKGEEYYYGRWYFFHDPNFCTGGPKNGDGGVDGNVADTFVAFWLRRTMDDTADLWAANLSRLLAIYDADWLGQHPV
jgi:hypothetical protein